ncbi:unnamed protein product [Paramecium pentaurelia]|uniref:Uncharacterized protein n=1 Tax=Paramecium pentaurelia TaxID=43138 RepID=A0A8S1W9C4_9CILI|nr:unnamed protein product [Paramecium pentaurelia]
MNKIQFSTDYINRINELEVMIKNFEVQDDGLKKEIQRLKQVLFESKESFTLLQKKKQQNKNSYNEEVNYKDKDIIKLRNILNEKENWIDQLNYQIQELQIIQEKYSRVETTVMSLQGEVDVWRQKCKEKNEEASELSQKLIMAEISLQNLKNRQITQIKDVNITKNNNNNYYYYYNRIKSVDTKKRLNRGSHQSQRQQV